MKNKKYDVCAIGNALVDYEIEVNDAFFSANDVEKGVMTLVDEARQNELLDLVKKKVKRKQGGGSAANTIFGLSQFGGKGHYTCKVANDEDGVFFMKDLREQGIASNLDSPLTEGITGKCLVMVTPDAERTMNTFLGITRDFSADELNEEAIASSRYLFMEGFLVSSPTSFEAMREARRMAVKNDTRVSMTFSDPSMAKYFRSRLVEVIGSGVDLLFCNIEEARLFTGLEDLDAVKEAISKIAAQYAITFGEKGALVYNGTDYVHISPFPVKAVDSTGAGDMFAGAFLYGINYGCSLIDAGRLACLAGSKVVGSHGPRLGNDSITEIKNILNKQIKK